MRVFLALIAMMLLAGCASVEPPAAKSEAPTPGTEACAEGAAGHFILVKQNGGIGEPGALPDHKVVTRDGVYWEISARQEPGKGIATETAISGGTLKDVAAVLEAAGSIDGEHRVIITNAQGVNGDVMMSYAELCDDFAAFATATFTHEEPSCVDGGGSAWTVSRGGVERTVFVAHCTDSGIAPFERALEIYSMPPAHITI